MADEVKKEETQQLAVMPAVMYPLSSPIRAYGEEVTVIKLRKPSGRDLLEVGNPVIFYPHVEPPRIEHHMDRVIAMAARTSDPSIPSSSLMEMDPQDMVGLAWAMSQFFTLAR